jgi:UDP-glucose-4-epimerase GalE
MTCVLVTGGAGYIGSQTAKALALGGFLPVVLDDLSTGHRTSVRWGPLVKGDVGNGELVRQVIRTHRVKAVIHFAASAYVGESVLEPRKYFRNNVANTLALLDSMIDTGVHNFVFSSTCATYGVPDALPVREDNPQRPSSPYGDSKLFVERALEAYGRAYGLRWSALRYFNAAGADPNGELGEDHDPETHLIPLAFDAAFGKRPNIDVYGTDYPTPDGTAIRDFVHVADLATAHVQALRYLLDGGESVALNLGSGFGHSVSEVIAEIKKVTLRPIPVRESPRRHGDAPALVADPRRAETILGWRPQFSDLEYIVRSAWNWHSRTVSRHIEMFVPQTSFALASD